MPRPNQHQCPLPGCGRTFKTEAWVKRHMWKTHLNDGESLSSRPRYPSKSDETSSAIPAEDERMENGRDNEGAGPAAPEQGLEEGPPPDDLYQPDEGAMEDDLGGFDGHADWTPLDVQVFPPGSELVAQEGLRGQRASPLGVATAISPVDDDGQGLRIDPSLPTETVYLHGVQLTATLPNSTRNDNSWRPRNLAPSPDPDDFRPFANYTDYFVTKTMKELGASREAIRRFLQGIKDPRFSKDELTISNGVEMERILADEIRRNGVKGVWKPVLWYKPIFDVVRQLLARPEIARFMDWVPRRYYHNGERIYFDFSGGEVHWALHHEHEKEGFAVPIHFYSDASKITTFRNTKVWPVHVWLENLPYEIRTRQEIVGSTLVGYIPVSALFELPQKVDVHCVIGHDSLHNNSSGNFGKHFFPLMLEEVPPTGKKVLDERIEAFPSYPGIRRFTSITDAPWVDAGAYRSLHAVLLTTAVGCLGSNEAVLLIFARHWAVWSMYEQLRVHTETTLQAQTALLGRFELLAKRTSFLTGSSFSYPKFHNNSHAPARTRLTAPDNATSTRHGEELHRLDHSLYKTTNKKEIMQQLTRQQDEQAVLRLVNARAQGASAVPSTSTNPPQPPPSLHNVSSSKQKYRLQSWLANQARPDEFPPVKFRYALKALLSDPTGARQDVSELEQDLGYQDVMSWEVVPHRLAYVKYRDYKTWDFCQDRLRCDPQDRQDSVVYARTSAPAVARFGRLLIVFELIPPNADHRLPPVACVQAFNYLNREEATWLPVVEPTNHLTFTWLSDIIRSISTPPIPKDSSVFVPSLHRRLYINEFASVDHFHRLNHLLGSPIRLDQSFFHILNQLIESQPEFAAEVPETELEPAFLDSVEGRAQGEEAEEGLANGVLSMDTES
ncbi:hypothetical protein JCM5296_000536 [Sporobolomyces johnsonii]